MNEVVGEERLEGTIAVVAVAGAVVLEGEVAEEEARSSSAACLAPSGFLPTWLSTSTRA